MNSALGLGDRVFAHWEGDGLVYDCSVTRLLDGELIELEYVGFDERIVLRRDSVLLERPKEKTAASPVSALEEGRESKTDSRDDEAKEGFEQEADERAGEGYDRWRELAFDATGRQRLYASYLQGSGGGQGGEGGGGISPNPFSDPLSQEMLSSYVRLLPSAEEVKGRDCIVWRLQQVLEGAWRSFLKEGGCDDATKLGKSPYLRVYGSASVGLVTSTDTHTHTHTHTHTKHTH